MQKCELIIRDCSLLASEYRIIKHQSIAIDGSTILEIGPAMEMERKYRGNRELSGKGKLATPGFIDGHTHITQQMLRGRITDQYPIIYLRFNLPYESRLTEEDVRLCSELSCLEMIKGGITSFADAGGVHVDSIVETVAQAGLRASLTRATSDRGDVLPVNMKDPTAEAVRKSEELFRMYNGTADDRIRIWFQFRSVATCTDELIRTVAEKAREYNTGLHTHLCEYAESIQYTLNDSQVREVEYLDRLGAVGPNLLAAHGILLSDRDLQILKERDARVIHCPRSNLGKGVTKTPQMLGMGLSVGFGTDGTAHSGLSMFREITAFRHSQIVTWGVPYFDSSVMPSETLLDMAFMGGARAMQREAEIGSLEAGKKADMMLINIDQPHILPTQNLVNTLTETVESGDIQDVIVNGTILMENRQVTTLDEERILHEARKRMEAIAEVNDWDPSMLYGDG